MPDILNTATRPLANDSLDLYSIIRSGSPKGSTEGLTQAFRNEMGLNINSAPTVISTTPYSTDRLKSISGYEEFQGPGSQFNPDASDMSNVRGYAARQGTWEYTKNTGIKLGSTAWNSFLEGWKQNARNVNALTEWDASKLYYTDDEQTKLMDEQRYKYPTFGTGEFDNSWQKYMPWNAGRADFYGEMLPQLGFTVGTMGQAIIENMLIAGITGGMGNIANAPKLAWTAARLGKGFENLYEAATGIKNLKRGLTALSSISKEASVGANLANIGKGIANGYAIFNTAASEAAFEANSSYNETKQELINEFVEKNGYKPFGEDLKAIETASQKAATATFGWNIPVLTASNLIQFNNILKPFKSATANALDDVGLILDKTTDTFIEKPLTKWNKYFNYAKSFGKGVLEPLSEGLEESSQAIISKSAREYYSNQLDATDPSSDIWDALQEGFNYATSSEGMDEFVGGFIGGALFKGVGKVADKLGVQEKLGFGSDKKRRLEKEELKREAFTILNSVNSKDVLDYILDPNNSNLIQQVGHQQKMKEAALMNDKISYNDAKTQSIRDFIYAGLKTGQLNLKLSQLEILKEMTDEQLAGVEKIDLTAPDAQEKIQKLRNKVNTSTSEIYSIANNLVDDYAAVEAKYGNPFEKNTTEYHAWEQAKKERVFSRDIVESDKRRANSIREKISADSEGKFNTRMFDVILDKNLRDEYIKQMKVYEEVEEKTPEIKNKIKEIELLRELDEQLKEGSVDLNQLAQSLYNLQVNDKSDLNDFVDKQSTQLLINDIEDVLKLESRNVVNIKAYNYLNNKDINESYQEHLKAIGALKESIEDNASISPVAPSNTGVSENQSPSAKEAQNNNEVALSEDLSDEDFVNQINANIKKANATFSVKYNGPNSKNPFAIKSKDKNGNPKADTLFSDRKSLIDEVNKLLTDPSNFKNTIDGDVQQAPVDELDALQNKLREADPKNKNLGVFPYSTSSLPWEDRNNQNAPADSKWMARTEYFYDNLLKNKIKGEIVAIPVTDINIDAVSKKLGVDLKFMLNPEWKLSVKGKSGHVDYLFARKLKNGSFEIIDENGKKIESDYQDKVVRARHVNRDFQQIKNDPVSLEKIRNWYISDEEGKKKIESFLTEKMNKLNEELINALKAEPFQVFPFAVSNGIKNVEYRDNGTVKFSPELKKSPFNLAVTEEDINNGNASIYIESSTNESYKDPVTETYIIPGRPYLKYKNNQGVDEYSLTYLDNFKLSDVEKEGVKKALQQLINEKHQNVNSLKNSDAYKYLSGILKIDAKTSKDNNLTPSSKYYINVRVQSNGSLYLHFIDEKGVAQQQPVDEASLKDKDSLFNKWLSEKYHRVEKNLLKKDAGSYIDFSTGKKYPSYTHYLIGRADSPLTIRVKDNTIQEGERELPTIQKYAVIDFSKLNSSLQYEKTESMDVPTGARMRFTVKARTEEEKKKASVGKAPVQKPQQKKEEKEEGVKPTTNGKLPIDRNALESFFKNAKSLKEEITGSDGTVKKAGQIWFNIGAILFGENSEWFSDFAKSKYNDDFILALADVLYFKTDKGVRERFEKSGLYKNTFFKFEDYIRKSIEKFVNGKNQTKSTSTNPFNKGQGQEQKKETPQEDKYSTKSDIIGKTLSDGKNKFTVKDFNSKGTGIVTTEGATWTFNKMNAFSIVGDEQGQPSSMPMEEEIPPTPTEQEYEEPIEDFPMGDMGTEEDFPISESQEEVSHIQKEEKKEFNISEEGKSIIDAKRNKFKASQQEEENKSEDNEFFKVSSSELEPLSSKEIEDVKKMLSQLDFQFPEELRKVGNREVWGSYINGVIKLYRSAKKGTAYHEAFEAVYNGILTKEQQDALYDDFIKREGVFTTYLGETKNYSSANRKEAKEQMADEFIDYKYSGKANEDVEGFFNKLLKFLKDIYNKIISRTPFLRNAATPSLETIYSNISNGYYNGIPVRNETNEYYKLEDLPVHYVQEFMQTSTAFLFGEMLKTSSGKNMISALEEGSVSKSEFFQFFKNKIKEVLLSDSKELDDLIQLRIDYLKYKNNKSKEKISNDKIVDIALSELERVIYIAENIYDDFDNFITIEENHLKGAYGLFFDESSQDESDRQEQEKEGTKASNEYTKDALAFDNFKSVSATIKLIIGTIAEKYYDGKATYDVISDVTFLPKAGLYYKLLFNKTMNYLQGINNPQILKDKLESLVNDPTVFDAKSSIDSELFRASMKELYNIIFKNEIKTPSDLKLAMRFYGSFSRQKPSAYIIKIDEATGNTYVVDENFESNVQDFKKRFFRNFLNIGRGWFKNKDISIGYDGRGTIYFNNSIKNIPSVARSKKDLAELLSGFGFPVTLEMINKITPSEYNDLNNSYKSIASTFKKKAGTKIEKKNKKALSYSDLDINGPISTISHIVGKYSIDDTQPMRNNREGKAQNTIIDNNYISLLFSDLNNFINQDTKDLEEFKKSNPHLFGVYQESSLIMQRFLAASRGEPVSLPKVSLYTGIDSGSKSKVTDKLNEPELFISRFNLSFDSRGKKAIYPIYENADSSTDYYIEAGQYFTDEDVKEGIHLDTFKKYLVDEIRAASAYLFQTKKGSVNLEKEIEIKPVDSNETIKRTSGTSLSFAYSYLTKSAIDKIHEKIDEGSFRNKTSEQVLSMLKGLKLDSMIQNYLQERVNEEFEYLKQLKYVEEIDNNQLATYMINDTIFSGNQSGTKRKESGGKESTAYDRNVFLQKILVRQVNNFANTNELSKVIFGRPNNQKGIEDSLKRYKNFMSPRITTISSNDLNETANEVLNNVTVSNSNTEISFKLNKGDLGATNFEETYKVSIIDDVKVFSELSKHHDPYADIESTDGESYARLDFLREILWKSGGKFTVEQENAYQILTAYERLSLNNLGAKYSDKQRKIDEEILSPYLKNGEYNLDNIVGSVSVIKPIVTGPTVGASELEQNLIKTSNVPLTLYTVKGTKLEPIYINMLKKNVKLLAHPSAYKVGAWKSESIIDHKTGNVKSNPVTKELRTRDFNIQTETQNTKNSTSAGTQMMKLITANLYNRGVPRDFNGTIKEWVALSEEEKLKQSDNYRLDKNHREALEGIFQRGYIDMLDKLGIVEKADGSYEYDTSNEKMYERIKELVVDQGVPNNILDQLDSYEDGERVVNYEMMSDYSLIKSIIYSMVDKGIVSPKLNGSMKIQISGSLWEKLETEEGKNHQYELYEQYEDANKKKRYRKVKKAEEGKKYIISNTRLKFYSKGPNGTNRMQVMVSYNLLSKVNQRRVKMKMEPLTKRELIDYLNSSEEGQKLLRGVGFRIPTQAMNSIDSFEIVDILPDYMGDAIVVPSELPAKSGSDFDVDKLSVYFNNFTINNEGYPEYVNFDDSQDVKNKRTRYVEYVRRKYAEKVVGLDKFISSEAGFDEAYEDLISEEFQAIKNELKEIKKEDRDNEYSEGLKIFRKLPISIKELYWNKERELSGNGLKGKEKMSFYQSFTSALIESVDEKIKKGITSERLTYISRDRKTNKEKQESENVNYKSLKDTLVNLENYYPKYFNTLEENKEKYEKLYESLLSKFREKKSQLLNEKREDINYLKSIMDDSIVAFYRDLARENGIIDYEEFQKLPLVEQNSRKAVENKYFETIDAILTHPNSFDQLITPNDSSIAESAAAKIAELKGVKKESFFDFAKLNNTVQMIKSRISFLEYKKLIGIAAVGVTSHSNMQRAQYIIKANLASGFKTNTFKLDEDDVISISEIESQHKEGGKRIEINRLLSMFVDGTVDVVKKPWLINYGADSKRFGAAISGIKMGLDLYDIGLIINSPFAELHSQIKKLQDNPVSKFNPSLSEVRRLFKKEDFVDYFTTKYNLETVALEPVKKQDVEKLMKSVYENGVLSEEKLQEALQNKKNASIAMTLLNDYFILLDSATQLRAIIDSSNHETVHLKDSSIGLIKDSKLEFTSSREDGMVYAINYDIFDNPYTVSPSIKLRQTTFSGKLADNLRKFENQYLYKEILMPELYKLQKMAIHRLSEGNSKELFVKSTEEQLKSLEIAVLSEALYDTLIPASLMHKGLSSGTIEDNLNVLTDESGPMVDILGSLIPYVNKLDTGTKTLTGLGILDYFDIESDTKAGRFYLKLKSKALSSDVLASNVMYDSLMRLRANNNKIEGLSITYRDVYGFIMLQSIIRNGIGFNKNSMLQFMHKEDYRALAENIRNISANPELFDRVYIKTIQNTYANNEQVMRLTLGDFAPAITILNKKGEKSGAKIDSSNSPVPVFKRMIKNKEFFLMPEKWYHPKSGELRNATPPHKKGLFVSIAKEEADGTTSYEDALFIRQPYFLVRELPNGLKTKVWVFLPYDAKGTKFTREYQSSVNSQLNENRETYEYQEVVNALIKSGTIIDESEIRGNIPYNPPAISIPQSFSEKQTVVKKEDEVWTEENIIKPEEKEGSISTEDKPSITPKC